jgi:hypothetical protein
MNKPVFKIDGTEYSSVGQDVRVEKQLGDGRSIVVILTHEGIVIDCLTNGNPTGTSSRLYDALFGDYFDSSADAYAHLTDEQYEKIENLAIEKQMAKGFTKKEAKLSLLERNVSNLLSVIEYFSDRATIAERLGFYAETGTSEEPQD